MKHGGLVAANIRQTVSRYRALLAALALGAALVTAIAAVLGSVVADDAEALQTESSLTTIRIINAAPTGAPPPLTSQVVADIRALPGVSDAVGTLSVGTSVSLVSGGGSGAATAAEQGLSGAFFALPRISWAQPAVTSGRADAPLGAGEVLIPDTALDSDLTSLVGARVGLEYIQATGTESGVPRTLPLTVVGTFDNTSPLRDGDAALYLSDADYATVLGGLLGSPDGVPSNVTYDDVLIRVNSVADAAPVARELVAQGHYILAGGTDERLPPALALLSSINTILAVLLGLFTIGIGVTLGSTAARSRRWEVGLLTGMGWSRRDIARQHASELLGVGAMVGILGAGLGVLLALAVGLIGGGSLLGFTLADGAVLPAPGWLAATLLGIPAALLLGALVPVLRLSSLEPDVALRRADQLQ